MLANLMMQNLSARLMAAAKAGILCDQSTREAARNAPSLQFDTLDPIRVKGKAHPIPVYIPHKKANKEQKPEQVFEKPLVGRATELKQLRSYVAQLVPNTVGRIPGRTQVVTIEGVAGVGKSRLVDQVIAWVKEKQQKVFIGTATELENSKSYHAWQDVFSNVLDSQKKLPRKIEDRLDPALLPLLNVVLPLDKPDTDKMRSMSGQMRSESTQMLLCQLLTMVVPPGSLIVLENSHWYLNTPCVGLTRTGLTLLHGDWP